MGNAVGFKFGKAFHGGRSISSCTQKTKTVEKTINSCWPRAYIPAQRLAKTPLIRLGRNAIGQAIHANAPVRDCFFSMHSGNALRMRRSLSEIALAVVPAASAIALTDASGS